MQKGMAERMNIRNLRTAIHLSGFLLVLVAFLLLPHLAADGMDTIGGTTDGIAEKGERFPLVAKSYEWEANGTATCTPADYQYLPQLISNGVGGAIITRVDHRTSTNEEVYAQRVNSTGNAQWGVNGIAICTAADEDTTIQLVNDGFGGAIITWEDERTGDYNLYTQRVIVFESSTDLSASINNEAVETGSTRVTLILSATGATEMCFSNDGTTYTTWEAYGTSMTWVLDDNPGEKTVYFKTRNNTIVTAVPVTDTIVYIIPPTNLSVSINGGAAETATPNVTLTLSATGATQMCFSNDGITYTEWEAYNIMKAWTLESGAGVKTGYFRIRNSTIEAAGSVTDTIMPNSGVAVPGFSASLLLMIAGFAIFYLAWQTRRTPHS